MTLSTGNRKRKQLGDGVAPFEFPFQTQKIKRVSRVFETQQNLAVENKPTTSLPLRKGLSPKQIKTIPLASSPRKHRKSEELGFDGLCQTQKIKRQKLGFEFDCSEILGCLMNLRHVSRYFEKPVVVDPVYVHDIWRPMDFGTVKSKLERGVYSSPDVFAADVRLTLSNALRYYPPGRIERAAAKHLSGVFESKWKEVLEKNPKSVCPSPLPKVKGLVVLPKLKQGKTSSPSSVRLGLPLKKLGVFLREDDELQGQDEEAFLNGDWEEGEIWWEEAEICS
ncbi:hypothetical protein GBA52_014311 [Prunus armeniaca]|nr:hypothetical protein GBA52_014311 [Prunus armeniaca]